MAAAATHVDELVKEYLLQRGLTSSFRAFELELKNEKEKGLRVDKLLDQLQQYISSFDLTSLREYWSRLNTRLFSRLDQRYMAGVRKMEVGLLKFYLIYATQNNKHDKIMEFFEKLTTELQNQPEFREWFILPFVRNPEEHPLFSIHFTRQWQETYFLSLHNFLSAVLQVIPRPTLLAFEEDTLQKKKILQENEMLKMKLHAQIQAEAAKHSNSGERRHTVSADLVHPSEELIFDFSGLSDESLNEKTKKTGKRFALNFSSSPLLGKKLSVATLKKSESSTAPKEVPKSSKNRNNQGFPIINGAQANTSGLKVGSFGNISGSPSHSEESLSGVASSRSRHQMEEYEKQRRALLGLSDSSRSKDKKSGINMRPSEGDVTASRYQGSQRLANFFRSSSQAEIDVNSTSPDIRSTGSSPSNFMIGCLNESPSFSLNDRHGQGQVQGRSGSDPALGEASSSILFGGMKKDLSDNEAYGRADKLQAMESNSPSNYSKVSDDSEELPFLLLSQEEYGEHRSGICYCRFSNSGQYVASLDADGVVKVWTWSPQPATKATCMAKSPFLSLEWSQKSDRLLLLGNRSGNIRLFDVKDKRSVVEACTDQSYPRICCLCSSPSTNQFVCSATTSKMKSGSVTSGNGGQSTAAASRIGRLSIWNLKTMKMEKTLPIDGGGFVAVNCCAFNHNGQLLIVGAVDGAVRMFDMQQQKTIAKWAAHEGEVLSLQFSSDETSCFTMGIDNKFYQWSILQPGKKLTEFVIFHTATSPIIINKPFSGRETLYGRSFAFDSEGHYMLTCHKNEGIIYEINSEGSSGCYADKHMLLKGHQGLVTTVDWSPSVDTRICLTGSLDGKVKISTMLTK
ncbi:WD repeat-containing protein 91 isoform X1 [Octopus sinensis]|uniref:WD repeat-containing protein 91 n=1 Tax=Octopus sinensis TaxID=2607531 RepID=A0A7E6FMX2_9MOLL|nr:WD repeat-containing protein 91 isoform X1 [Octopus sinensis]